MHTGRGDRCRLGETEVYTAPSSSALLRTPTPSFRSSHSHGDFGPATTTGAPAQGPLHRHQRYPGPLLPRHPALTHLCSAWPCAFPRCMTLTRLWYLNRRYDCARLYMVQPLALNLHRRPLPTRFIARIVSRLPVRIHCHCGIDPLSRSNILPWSLKCISPHLSHSGPVGSLDTLDRILLHIRRRHYALFNKSQSEA